ncbi:MAG: hypothetical protein MUC73_09080 [Cyclobacteriaceae bacterium]|jgi:hypothetical protein|nr:hypothetical protein [Cyclobacteriaceae bacterium]
MIQNLLIAVLFGAALVYLGRMAYRSFTAKSCASGCGKCGVIDVDKIEKSIREKELIHH